MDSVLQLSMAFPQKSLDITEKAITFVHMIKKHIKEKVKKHSLGIHTDTRQNLRFFYFKI